CLITICPYHLSTRFPYTTLFRSRAPQHARHRQRGHGRVDWSRGGGYISHPDWGRGDHAAEPRAPAGGRTVWHAGVTVPRPHRSRSEEHTSELQSLAYFVCCLLLE